MIFLKVPIRYKSSDRYNAGVDVVYDDDSKLQYAPFIYATTASGDNGGDEGGDEEGEDTMVVNAIMGENALSLDKTWQEIHDAIEAGKCVYIRQTIDDSIYILHIDTVGLEVGLESETYIVRAHTYSDGSGMDALLFRKFEANTASDHPAYQMLRQIK